jgi:hypothetical protein
MRNYEQPSLYARVLYYFTHGGQKYHTTRWHRIKCRVSSTYYLDVKPAFLDWYRKRTYVPLVDVEKREIRAIRWQDLPNGGLEARGYEHHRHETFRLVKIKGVPGMYRLPPGIESIEELPHFPSAKACWTDADQREAWIHLHW